MNSGVGTNLRLAPAMIGHTGRTVMAIRYLKVAFVLIISLLCLVYAGQNVANLESCYQAFAYVMSNAAHEAYPASFLPSIESPILIWLALITVVGLEFVAGLLAAKGAWDLWAARKATADTFNDSKTFALLGAGIGIVVWLGLFGVAGGAVFQMWQTSAGTNSLNGAFQFFSSCAFVFLIVSLEDN